MSKCLPAPIGPCYFRLLFSSFVCLFLLVLAMPSIGQILPEEGRTLNYRIVGLSFPKRAHASRYVIEIAEGRYHVPGDFLKHVYLRVNADSNRLVVEVPFFGAEYSWRVIYRSDNIAFDSSSIFHFNTAGLAEDTIVKRIRVISRSSQLSDAYLLVDGVNKIYDLNGSPVWFCPDVDLLRMSNDLKVSAFGTITFLSGAGAYELGYDGQILWKTKNDDHSINHTFHHHEFTRLSNGRYMGLVAVIVNQDSAAGNIDNVKRKFFPTLSLSSLKEYDLDGNEVWTWEASKYQRQGDLLTFQRIFDGAAIDLHENAFYFDERKSVIYLSLAGIDRILKIQYPSGMVLAEYGSKLSGNLKAIPEHISAPWRKYFSNKYFHNPHAIKQSPDGFVYLCSAGKTKDNNDRSACIRYPKILKAVETKGALEKVWELDCRKYMNQPEQDAGGGGNVMPIEDNALFISLCLPYSNMFIVNRDKQLLWSAETELRQPDGVSWVKYPKYRASVITRQQLEQMIWQGK